jgi:hypothetical protein
MLCSRPDDLWGPVLFRDLQWQRMLPPGIVSVWRQLLQHRQLPQWPMRGPRVLPMRRYGVSIRQYVLRQYLLCWWAELCQWAVLYAGGVGVWGWGWRLGRGLGRQPVGGKHVGSWCCAAGVGRAVLGVIGCDVVAAHVMTLYGVGCKFD